MYQQWETWTIWTLKLDSPQWPPSSISISLLNYEAPPQPSSSSLPGSAGFLTRGWPMFVGCGSPSCLLHYELACQVKYNGSALSQRNREVQLHWVSPTRQVPLIPPRYIRFNLGQGVCGMAACRDADWENAKSYTEIYFCLTLHVWKPKLQNIWCR